MSRHHRKPLKLAIVLQDLEFGGTQRYAIHLLKLLDRDLFTPELWVLRGGDDMVALARETGTPIVKMSSSSWVTPGSLLGLFRELARRQPELIYTLTVVPNIWGRVFGRITRIPAVVSGYRSLLPKQHERLLWRLSDKIIANADALREIMIRRFSVDPDRIAVVPNGVAADFFSPAPHMTAVEPWVLSVGRFVEDKDPLNLLDAFRLAAEKVPAARFAIMGNGPLKQQAQQFICQHSLESRIQLLSGVGDIRPGLRKAWVFALGSVREASPNVILEAMSVGLPVVATGVGGIPELVVPGETGFLVPPRDPGALAQALADLLGDRDKCLLMGRSSRQRVLDEFTLEKMVRRTEKVLLEAAFHRRRPASIRK